MWIWLRQASASAAGKYGFPFLGSIFTGALFLESWEYLRSAPWPVMGLIITLSLLSLVFLVFVLNSWAKGATHPNYEPRYLARYKWPIWRTSWRFSNFLGGSCGSGRPVLTHWFQAEVRANWGRDIFPTAAYIQSRNSGERLPILVDVQRNGQVETYIELGSCEKMPSGKWLRVMAKIARSGNSEDALTREALISRFDGFNLVLEYRGGQFIRRFSRKEMLAVIDGFWDACNPPADDYVGPSLIKKAS